MNCPVCGGFAVMTVVVGPSEAFIKPCGHRVPAEVTRS